MKKRANYIDCNFILGSVGEVERVFSFAKYVLSDNRRCMTPQLFEALMFSKMNSRFWDAALVEEAIGEDRKERASARYMAHRVRDDDTDKEEYFRFFDEADMTFNANSSDIAMI